MDARIKSGHDENKLRPAGIKCSAWSRIKKPESKSPRPVFRRGLSSCDAEHMQVICPTCQIFSKALVATQGAHALQIGLRESSRELTARYRIDVRRNFSMLIAIMGAAQNGLDQAPTQSVDFLDCRLKTVNVPRQTSSIRLTSHREDVHGRN